MDDSTPLVAWVFLISGATIGILLAVTAGVFAWYQRQVADEARRWGRHLMAAQDEERQRIARELHDDVVPRLYVTRLALEREDPEEAHDQLGSVVADLRTMAHDLHPPALKHLDLQMALDDLVSRHRSGEGPAVTLATSEGISLEGDRAMALYRVAQEALSNARRHAQARAVTIRLELEGGGVRLTVADDGVGLPVDQAARASFGLRSMRERVEALGGALELDSTPGRGTTVSATLPRQ